MISNPSNRPATPEHHSAQSAIVTTGQPLETRWVDTQQLLQGSRALEIRHGSERYQLRVTRENRLILTK